MKRFLRFRNPMLLAALGVAALLAFAGRGLLREPAAAAASNRPPPVAVETAIVGIADVPIYLEGLGTVQAFYTVTVTARVDGQLQKIAFTEGQMVRAGDLLAQIDPRPNQAAYDQAVATKARDTAQLANAERDLERYKVLLPQDLASKQTFDTQRALVDQLGAQLKFDQAVIESAATQLDYTHIRSPIDGRTGIRLIDPGNNVHASDTTGIVVVNQVQPIAVIFTLPEDALPAIRAALESGPVPVTTLSRDGAGELDHGELALIDNQITQTTGTIRLKAIFSNLHNTLWPGQYVTARVLVRTARNSLTLPSSAVQVGPHGPFTYVVKDDSTVEARPVTIAEQNGTLTTVSGGLKQNERVVTTNQYRLQPGTLVQSAADAPAPTARQGAT